MGRYPFLTLATKYLDAVGGMYSEATKKELDRRLRRMVKDFQSLNDQGLIETMDPRRLREKEIIAYLGLLRARGLKESGMFHNVSTLRQLLLFCGNPVLDPMKLRYGNQLPRRRAKRYPPMNEKQVEMIIKASEGVKDWKTLQAYALVGLALSAGARTKELELAKIGDFDKENWILSIKHPKGEGTWGEERKAPILPIARSLLRRYLTARSEMISKRASLNEALFPTFGDEGDGYLSTNGVEKLKKIVQSEVGFSFDLRTCRRTFGQRCLDKGANFEAVSIVLGHSSIKTAEGYYCRKREDIALAEIKSVWTAENRLSVKKPFN
jgi:integrase/recombinase XerD